jgi:hypothetical protein
MVSSRCLPAVSRIRSLQSRAFESSQVSAMELTEDGVAWLCSLGSGGHLHSAE